MGWPRRRCVENVLTTVKSFAQWQREVYRGGYIGRERNSPKKIEVQFAECEIRLQEEFVNVRLRWKLTLFFRGARYFRPLEKTSR